MSNVFTLDSLREEADKQFAPVKIGLSDGSEVTLRNLLRLGEKDRELVRANIKLISASNDDESDEESSEDDSFKDIDEKVRLASEILAKVASDSRKLLKELDGDVGLILQVLQTWMEGTQSGEAQPSPA